MGMINRIPQGFLRMLGSQTGGENPSSSSNVVQPSIEMTPFYHGDSMSVEQLSGTPAVLGQQGVTVVPLDEAWMLYGASVAQTVILATDFSYTNINLRSLPNTPGGVGFGPIMHTGKMIGTDIVTPQQMVFAQLFPVPIPLQPGAELIWVLQGANVFRFTTITYVIARLSG